MMGLSRLPELSEDGGVEPQLFCGSPVQGATLPLHHTSLAYLASAPSPPPRFSHPQNSCLPMMASSLAPPSLAHISTSWPTQSPHCSIPQLCFRSTFLSAPDQPPLPASPPTPPPLLPHPSASSYLAHRQRLPHLLVAALLRNSQEVRYSDAV